MSYKGVILAGGRGTRLYPLTHVISKQLLPVYDKPMIHYPLSVLMLAGIREVLIVSTPQDLPRFEALFGDGSTIGMDIQYAAQEEPKGIPQALTIGADFIGDDPVCLVLGDNIFFGQGLVGTLRACAQRTDGATIFAYRVQDPERYGIVTFSKDGLAVGLDEKPLRPLSPYAVPGLYFYDNSVVERARALRPSARGELEIMDINRAYLAEAELNVEILGRGVAWLDTGTHESLLQAANFIQVLDSRQGLKVACVEEIAWRQGWISSGQLAALAEPLCTTSYGSYLKALVEQGA